uniref:Uncharacterized protein n=1 Tax=Lactuca sativa TaxID=4236 RepID=A0A9R1V7B5_LACSA|nr:hypothetical protein LSAT_V11C600337100 [Lactuca sativa]
MRVYITDHDTTPPDDFSLRKNRSLEQLQIIQRVQAQTRVQERDEENMLKRAAEAVAAKFRDSKTTYMLEIVDESMTEALQAVVIQNRDYDLDDTSQKSNTKSLLCSHFCFEDRKHKSPSVEDVVYTRRELPCSKKLFRQVKYNRCVDEAVQKRHNITASICMRDVAVSTGFSELLYESIKLVSMESENNLDDDLVNGWATSLADDGLWGSNAPEMNRYIWIPHNASYSRGEKGGLFFEWFRVKDNGNNKEKLHSEG